MSIAIPRLRIHRRPSLRLPAAQQLRDLFLEKVLEPTLDPQPRELLQRCPLGPRSPRLMLPTAVSSFLPVSPAWLGSRKVYTAFPLFPHPLIIPPCWLRQTETRKWQTPLRTPSASQASPSAHATPFGARPVGKATPLASISARQALRRGPPPVTTATGPAAAS